MDNPRSPEVYSLEAPYLPQLARYIEKPTTAPHRLFYRLTSNSAKKPTEIFAVGEFQSIELSWHTIRSAHNPWDLLKLEIQQLTATTSALMGTIDYETGYAFEPRWQNLSIPTSGYAFKFYQIPCWYQVDHHCKTAEFRHIDGSGIEALTVLRQTIESFSQHDMTRHSASPPTKATHNSSGELTQHQYCALVENILSDITAGRYYELNFTQRFLTSSSVSPNRLFATIDNDLFPAKAFYCESESEVICCFSPELFLRKSSELVITRPIKGSYREESLENREKLEAEHIMVVDLARNDIGRISDLAPVSCPEILSTHTLGPLHHLESQINGYTSLDWLEGLSHIYPAASITGAPKVEVVQAISEYEKSPRGLYTGTCGWIWPNGDVDLNVAIRTLVATKNSEAGWSYAMGAGGAIVADSIPSEEYRECLQKIEPFLNGIQAGE